MCTGSDSKLPEILSGAQTALQIGATVSQFAGAGKQAKAVKENATGAMHDAWAGLTLREGQEQAATAQSVMAIERAARAQRATAALAAGESGVSGLSVDALLNDITANELGAKQIERRNLDMTVEQLQREKVSGYATAQSRIASAPAPNPWLAALQIGAEGLDFGRTIYDRRHPEGG